MFLVKKSNNTNTNNDKNKIKKVVIMPSMMWKDS